jgi:hypothetical protein
MIFIDDFNKIEKEHGCKLWISSVKFMILIFNQKQLVIPNSPDLLSPHVSC